MDSHSLLHPSFHPDAILVRSSDFQRTKKTAKLIIEGIYASHSETIPIHVIPKQEDRLFLGFLYNPGKEMQNLMRSQYNHSSTLPEDTEKEINLELKKINDKFGTNLSDISDIAKVADIIRTSEIHNSPLAKKISDKEIEKIFKLTELLFIDIFKAPNAACAGAGALIKQILEKMHDKRINKTSLKYALFFWA